MIAKKVTYEMRIGMAEPFFLKEPEACAEARRLVSGQQGQGAKETTDAEHEALWAHVEGCLLCLRNAIRMMGSTLGGVPLPVWVGDDGLAGRVRFPASQPERN